jgi:acyl carrier protein
MAESVSEKVIAIIAEQAVLEPSDVSMDATLEDLGIDSLGLVESIFAIEEAFDIQVPFNANEPDERFRHLVRGLHRARGRDADLGAIHRVTGMP